MVSKSMGNFLMKSHIQSNDYGHTSIEYGALILLWAVVRPC